MEKQTKRWKKKMKLGNKGAITEGFKTWNEEVCSQI
jgi:hypothetical protein